MTERASDSFEASLAPSGADKASSGESVDTSAESDDELSYSEDNAPYSEDSFELPPSLCTPADSQRTIVRKVCLLYNPASGSHRGTKIANKAAKMLEKAGVEIDMVQLEEKGHGERICQTKDLAGIDVIAIVGGDGTFHECINGMMRRKDSEIKRVALAMIAGGTGNSFAWELRASTSTRSAVKSIIRGIHVPIDLSEVVFPGENKTQEVIYSFNSIHWGLASKVNVVAEKLRWMGNAIRYTTAALYELFHGEKTLAKVVVEDKDGKIITYEEEICLIIANNIVTAAKGMKLAPNAKLNDGLIDLIIIRSSSIYNLMILFPKLYTGTHSELPFVEYIQVKSFSITPYTKDTHQIQDEADPEVAEELLDVDGELKGLTPFRCTVLPRSIRVIV